MRISHWNKANLNKWIYGIAKGVIGEIRKKEQNISLYSSREEEGKHARTFAISVDNMDIEWTNKKKMIRILTTVFIVIYFDSILFLRVLTSWSHSNGSETRTERRRENKR